MVYSAAVLGAAFVFSAPLVAAKQYTVWSSVIFARTGDRTPYPYDGLSDELTTLGAQQAYDIGAFYRCRYLTFENATYTNGFAPIVGLNKDDLDNEQFYATTLDYSWTSASAQAFVQGLYPPFQPNSTDSTTLISTGRSVFAPLGGYQYPQIHISSGADPNFIFSSAHLDCPSWDAAAQKYYATSNYTTAASQFKDMFQALGSAFLVNVFDPDVWNLGHAYDIYTYLDYQNTHNTTAHNLLATFTEVTTGTSYLEILKDLVNQQITAQFTSLDNHNTNTHFNLPNGTTGSISTISGNYLASKILSLLQNAILLSESATIYKLNLIIADFPPLLSLFTLLSLPGVDPTFTSLPAYGSSAVFELFTYTDSSDPNNLISTDLPDPEDLWVRFYFRNASQPATTAAPEPKFQAYSLFDRGPDGMDMPWLEFQDAMNRIAVGDIGTWCLVCGAANLFCAAWNATDAAEGVYTGVSGSGDGLLVGGKVGGVVGGIIGAVVALAVAAVLVGLVMLFGGVRVVRVETGRRGIGAGGGLNGFKGGKKMASDRDLSLAKDGTGIVVVSEERGEDGVVAHGGHERVGSWELKQAKMRGEEEAHGDRVASLDVERDLEGQLGPVVKPYERI